MKIFLNFIQLEQQLRSDKDINKVRRLVQYTCWLNLRKQLFFANKGLNLPKRSSAVILSQSILQMASLLVESSVVGASASKSCQLSASDSIF